MIEECGTGYKEMRLRQIRKKALEVIPKKPGPGPDPPPPTLVPPGAIGIFIAKKGSGVLDQVREAATKGGAVADKFAAKLTSQLKKRKTMSVGDAVDLIAKQSVFADVRYGGATVCNGLFVPKGLDCAVVLLPYNGGRLLADGFQLAEYLQDGTKDGLEGIAVVSQPPLSAAEIAAHLAVPEDQIELNVGFASWCDTTAWAVAAVVAVAVLVVVALATAGCVAVVDKHLSEAQIKKLGPAASARKMLDLRRTALRELAGVKA
ncbi:MAG: hypothetical protein U0575_08975 [Phycisphaerales bacterium]